MPTISQLVRKGRKPAGKKVKAPVPSQWFGSPAADAASFQPSPTYGFMCPVLQTGVAAPSLG